MRKIHLQHLLKKNPHLSGPLLFKPMLFKAQLCCGLPCTAFLSTPHLSSRRTPPTPTSMLKGDYRGFHGLFAPFWLNNCLYGLVQAGAVREVCKKLQTPILLPHHTGQRPNSCPPCQAHTMPTSSHQTAKSSRSPQYLAQSRVLTKYVWSAQDRGHTNEPCAGHQNGFQHQPL